MSRESELWDAFCERVREVGHQVLAEAPDDPFDRAEGLRYVTRLARHFLRASLEDADPAAVRLTTETPKIGLDNPDYVYFGARLSPAFEYRLRGRLGDASLIGFGTFSGGLGTPQGLVRDGYLTSDALSPDADGRFEIALSREEREGAWLPLGPETNALQVRQTLLDRRHQTPATMELVRVDGGAPPAPLEPERFARGLARAGGMLAGTVAQFLGWTRSFQAHTHEVREIDPALLRFAQGDPNTRYLYAYWELADDEAFVVSFRPPACDYWNLQVGNHWLESFDFLHYRTHVNHRTASIGDDGRVQVAVASRPCGFANRLETAGHRRGALALRFVGADETPPIEARVVRIGESGSAVG